MAYRDKALQVISRIGNRPAAELRPEMELVADLQIDSPKALQLLVELEEELDIEIGDEDAAKMDTVGDILSFLDNLAA